MVFQFLIMLISLALLAIFLYHLLGPRDVWDFDQAEGFLTGLQKRRDRILRALKDIEFERETGTLQEGEFFRLRHEFKRQAIEAMKELDRARSVRMRYLTGDRAATDASLRRRVEALVKERKEQG